MATQFISAICVLGIVVIGLMVITQRIALEEVFGFIARTVAVILAVLLTLCVLRNLFLTVALPWIASLARVLVRVLALGILAILAVFAAKLVLNRFHK